MKFKKLKPLLLLLMLALLACKDNNDQKFCMEKSTNIIEVEARYFRNKIHKNNRDIPTDKTGIELANKSDSIYDQYFDLNKILDSISDIGQMNLALERYHNNISKCFQINAGQDYQNKLILDSLHLIKYTSEEAIKNIAAIELLKAIRMLASRNTFEGDLIFQPEYKCYTKSDTFKLTEGFTGFVNYEEFPTRNFEYNNYRITSIKRNGIVVNDVEIKLNSNKKIVTATTPKKGHYEINMHFDREMNYSTYQNRYPLKIEFDVVE